MSFRDTLDNLALVNNNFNFLTVTSREYTEYLVRTKYGTIPVPADNGSNSKEVVEITNLYNQLNSSKESLKSEVDNMINKLNTLKNSLG